MLGTVVEAEGPSLLVPWSSLSLQVSRNASGRLLNVPLFLFPFDENCSFSQQNVERASEQSHTDCLPFSPAEAVVLSAVGIQVCREKAESFASYNEERQMFHFKGKFLFYAVFSIIDSRLFGGVDL